MPTIKFTQDTSVTLRGCLNSPLIPGTFLKGREEKVILLDEDRTHFSFQFSDGSLVYVPKNSVEVSFEGCSV